VTGPSALYLEICRVSVPRFPPAPFPVDSRRVTSPGSVLRVLAAGLLLLGFATPARVLWEGPDAPWWTPFALWGLAIFALYLAGRTKSTDDGAGPQP
jgi:hypothetical protein